MIFNTTKDRQPKALLSHFATCSLDLVIFTTNLSQKQSCANTDNTNHTASDLGQVKRCEEHQTAWSELQYEKRLNNPIEQEPYSHGPHKSHIPSSTAGTINEAMEIANALADKSGDRLVQVLVTGSIHLVGGVLQILEPDLFERTDDVKEEERLSELYAKIQDGR